MSDLLTHLREYGSQLDSQATPLEDLTPTEHPLARVRIGWRGPLIAVGTASAIVVIAMAAALLLRGPEPAGPTGPIDEPTVTTLAATTIRPDSTGLVGVFSWDGDDLGVWVTEDEMADALEDVVRRYADAEPDGEVLLSHLEGDDDWTWRFGAVGATEGRLWRVIAHTGDHSPEGGVVKPTETDPRLPQGVTYQPLSGFAHGFYGLSGPNSDQTICMKLFPPGTSFSYPQDSQVKVHEDMVFALASMMLQEMGWAD